MDKQRLTLQEAAHRLGVSESAIRKRIKRGTLEHEKTEDGRALVYLDAPSAPSAPVADTMSNPHTETLISEMQARIQLLEDELEAWREESRRKDTIIMNMTEAMKALNPPPAQEESSEPREAPVTAPETESKGDVPPEPRSWWRRIFGG